MDKLEESPIKPPPDAMAKARTEGVAQEKNSVYQAGKAVKTIVGAFFGMALFAALYLLGVLAFGGRMHFWEAYAVAASGTVPALLIQSAIRFIILFVRSTAEIHPN